MAKSFKTAFMGGFNKSDVLSYIRDHVTESEGLKEQLQQLEESYSLLEQKLDSASRQNALLRSDISSLKALLEEKESEIQNLRSSYQSIFLQAADNLREAAAILEEKAALTENIAFSHTENPPAASEEDNSICQESNSNEASALYSSETEAEGLT